MARLLEGIRVIDFGRFIAAPYAAMMLADFGADVIRVERREGGEDRTLGPVTEGGEGGLFLNLNRNKRGLTLDLAHPLASEIVNRLVRSADIVVVNLPFDVMKKLALDYDSLRAVKDDVILVMASAFGPDGPYRDRVGFDGVAQAMSGAMCLSGVGDDPRRSVVSWVDYGTALHAAFGAMAALYHRANTGKGQLIDVSLLATSVMFMTPLLMERSMTDIRRQRARQHRLLHCPQRRLPHARRLDHGANDRRCDVSPLGATGGQGGFDRRPAIEGRHHARHNHAEVINEVMNEWCTARTRDEAIAQLERARIPCGPIYQLDEVLNDAQVRARGLFQQTTFPGSRRSVPLGNPAVRLSESPGEVRHRAPTLGEHTDLVLRELGFTSDEIAAFRNQSVV